MIDYYRQLGDWLAQGLAAVAPERAGTPIVVERPKQAAHGDYATNVALQHAKALKRNPRELAQALVAALPPSDIVAKTEIAGAGFINLFLTPAARAAIVTRILAERERFGRSERARGERVMVEFVSANPTGPLHVGHGRQAALGDAVATLLEWQGAEVTREFYYNDAGQQIQNLAISVRARAQELLGEHTTFPEDGYRGEYIRELAQRYLDEVGHDLGDIESIRRFAVAELRKRAGPRPPGVRRALRQLLPRELALHDGPRRGHGRAARWPPGQTYEQDGALWLKTTAFGDDKDRVMRKSDGGYTYFVPDVAYHVTKWERGFARAINVQGSDHHSTVTRVRAGLQAVGLGIPAGYPDYVLHKMVTVMKGGEEVKISKRAGSYVTLRDLIDEVGRDAVRFFLVTRKADTEFTFDVDLARSQSEENPVYYVQYAHARVSSVMKQAGIDVADAPARAGRRRPRARSAARTRRRSCAVSPTCRPSSRPPRATWRRISSRPTCGSWPPNSTVTIMRNASWSTIRGCRRARLALVAATGQVLRNALAVLGLAAPDAM